MIVASFCVYLCIAWCRADLAGVFCMYHWFVLLCLLLLLVWVVLVGFVVFGYVKVSCFDLCWCSFAFTCSFVVGFGICV